MATGNLTKFAWLSVAAAVATIALKAAAYLITGSVGLLSDALESLVNLAAASMALAMLTVAARPPDEMYAFGYGKAEYFSSGVEGALILLAAAGIVWTALPRLAAPQRLEQVGIGLAQSVLASVINFAVARRLLKAGKEYRSITLEADARHLLTDVWDLSGNYRRSLCRLPHRMDSRRSAHRARRCRQHPLDRRAATTPLAAWANGCGSTGSGPKRHQRCAEPIRAPRHSPSCAAHAPLRYEIVHFFTRAGAGSCEPCNAATKCSNQVERDIRAALPGSSVFTHLEAVDDPASWEDIALDRADADIGAKRD
jgi:hypothetical protein